MQNWHLIGLAILVFWGLMKKRKLLSTMARLRSHIIGFGGMVLGAIAMLSSFAPGTLRAVAQTGGDRQPLQLRADIQEANAVTGVVTARGNVRINYPARGIQATAVQAQYFSRERRIVLSGNVYVLQNGNSLRAETITYLVDEGRFVALPDQGRQVEAIYLVPDPNPSIGTPSTPTPTPIPAPPSLPPIP